MERRAYDNSLFNNGQGRLGVFPGEKPLTPLGVWINDIIETYNLSSKEAAETFGVKEIRALRKNPIEKVSVDTFVKLLEGAFTLSYPQNKIDSLLEIYDCAVILKEKNVNKYRNDPTRL